MLIKRLASETLVADVGKSNASTTKYHMLDCIFCVSNGHLDQKLLKKDTSVPRILPAEAFHAPKVTSLEVDSAAGSKDVLHMLDLACKII